MPLLRTKKEVFEWLLQGKKTIDIRKGKPRRGEIAVFEAGPHVLRLRITGRESGNLIDLVHEDNFRQVIPTAQTLEEAIGYLRRIYGDWEGVFTAYFVEPAPAGLTSDFRK